MIAATATHCFVRVGFGDPIIATKTVKQIVKQTAEYIIMFLRPSFSIVEGKRKDPMAKTVFITAARSWEIVEERPICEKILTL
jgi:hypothetical protein